MKFLLIFIFTLSCASKKREAEFDVLKEVNLIDKKDESKANTKVSKDIRSSWFSNQAKQYGLDNVKAYNFNLVDINGDNYSDLVVIPSFFSQPEFYYFSISEKKFIKGDGPFVKPIKASYLLFYDINNDKILDAIVGVLNQKTELTKESLKLFLGKKDKNKNLVFDEYKNIYVPSSNSSLGLIDYNLDGHLDFYIGNWLKRARGTAVPQHDALILNEKGKFKDMTLLLEGEANQNIEKSMYVNATPTYAVQICDIDQNGYPDILTTSTNNYHNKLWMNRYKTRSKNRIFQNTALESQFASDENGSLNKRGGGRSFAVACTDYNNDEIMDAFIGELSHLYDNDGVDKSSILTGRTFSYPPKFYRTEYFLDSTDPDSHQSDRRGVWVDYNFDGLIDLLVDNSGYPPYTKLILFEQQADHSFSNISENLGIDIINPTATVVGDFNKDGRPDILTAQSNIRDANLKNQIYLFINQTPTMGRKRLRVFLRGKKSNYYGLNATVKMYVKKINEEIEVRTQNVSYSYGALPPQNEEGLFFGLQEGEELLKFIVTWPFSDSINTFKAQLERTYKIKTKLPDYLDITLCEEGNYLIGHRDC